MSESARSWLNVRHNFHGEITPLPRIESASSGLKIRCSPIELMRRIRKRLLERCHNFFLLSLIMQFFSVVDFLPQIFIFVSLPSWLSYFFYKLLNRRNQKSKKSYDTVWFWCTKKSKGFFTSVFIWSIPLKII